MTRGGRKARPVDCGGGFGRPDPGGRATTAAGAHLVHNAIKFTPNSGRVEPRLTRADAGSDNGRGISPQFLPFVFDPFRQQDASTTRDSSGLGLGPSIAKHLVELHGGTIEALSAGPGQGATFVVTLPVSLSGPAANATDESRAASV